MAFCSKCGAAMAEGSTFCGKCGAPVSTPAGAPASPPPPPPVSAQSGQMSSNVAGLLAYILGLITGIIFLVIEPYKNDRFVRFHAFQSIFYCIAAIVISILWSIVGMILGSIFMLGMLWWTVGTLIRLAFFLIWLFLMYKAYNNERFMLPVIGEMAAKQAG
jgi:uncharacterized membrane protein